MDVGTNGGTAWTRPGSVPTASDTVLVSSVGYNAAGWQDTATDPKGRVGTTSYDALGRVVKTVGNYVDGVVSDADDRTIEYGFDSAGRPTAVTVRLPGGGVQTTETVYGTSAAGGDGVTSNDRAKATRQPDPTTGLASASEADTWTVNAPGRRSLDGPDGDGHTYTRTPSAGSRWTRRRPSAQGGRIGRRIETSTTSRGTQTGSPFNS